MYYIVYEGLKIESNEPVYCTMHTVHVYNTIQCTMYIVHALYTVEHSGVPK